MNIADVPSSEPLVIAFSGKAGAGKTTIAREVAKVLIREESLKVETLNFADGLRDVIELVYGIPTEMQKDDVVKKAQHEVLGGNTLRFALQHLGTEGFRAVSSSTWVNYWLKRLAELKASGVEVVLVEDMRFPNEMEAILRLPSNYLIHIEDVSDLDLEYDEKSLLMDILHWCTSIFKPNTLVHESETYLQLLKDASDCQYLNDKEEHYVSLQQNVLDLISRIEDDLGLDMSGISVEKIGGLA